MTAERKFAWQPWIDPLGSNLDDFGPQEIPDEADLEFYNFGDSQVAVNTAKDLLPEYEAEFRSKIHKIQPVKVINTKLGLLTVVESTVANYHFEFWILHSNKQFTEEDMKIIAECDAVDAVLPLTRYRMKVGFPKSGLFDLRAARKGVEDALIIKDVVLENRVDGLFTEETELNITNKIANLKKKGGKWLLYVLPNGAMEVFETEAINNTFRSKLKVFEESQKLVGGRVFKS